MNSTRLILRSLVHFRRTHAGVVAGAIVATAVLTGALLIGDSVRHTLRDQALDRIGSVDAVLLSGDRFFGSELSDRIESATDVTRAAPILQLRSVVSAPSSGQAVQRVNILGIDRRFGQFARSPTSSLELDRNQCLLNTRLSNQLGASIGDELIIRVRMPNALAADSVLGATDNILPIRVEVAGVLPNESFGRFSLSADQIPPANLFVNVEWLQDQLDLTNRANLLLLDAPADDPRVIDRLSLAELLQPNDYQLKRAETANREIVEYRSDRIFISAEIERAAILAKVPETGVLTYFVNTLECGDRSVPYSMVAAIGPLGEEPSAIAEGSIPSDMADNEIIINNWLRDDLRCDVGDTLVLRYFITDDQDKLLETSTAFTIRAITPMEGLAADGTLMPDFPGIAEAEAGRDWDPGIPLDLSRLRDTDEEYWDEFRGTPKAFVTLSAGKAMWGNRYGSLTGIRFSNEDEHDIANAITERVDPASVGFVIQDVRTPALRASQATTDFGSLFLALSFFLIFAALMLMGLLFVFNIEQRSRELGTLMAMGFPPRSAGRILWLEGTLLATLGSAIGAIAGIGYAKLVLGALASIWSDAVASASIQLFVSPQTVLIGFFISLFTAGMIMHLTLRRAARKEVVVLLAGEIEASAPTSRKPRRPLFSMIVSCVSLLGAIVIVVSASIESQSAAGAFFGAGALLLFSMIVLSRMTIVRLGRATDEIRPSLTTLALRNTARRLNRSTATITLLAFGIFLVVGVSGSRMDSNRNAADRESGTGGFAFLGETTLPVSHDLNETRGRDAFGLANDELFEVRFVPLFVRDGDDASCLNLNRPQRPRLLGVDPELLAERGSFNFARFEPDPGNESAWNLLAERRADGAIPAIVDDASATWSMHKSVGDTIEYTNERGGTISIVIVATIKNSILQGNVLISEEFFRDMYPSEVGARLFLVDAPEEGRNVLATRLGSAMADVGLELTPASQRLAEYSAVQNTYLVIFQMLGAMGLLLGTVGLGVVVVRNLLERRAELAMLRAVGFEIAQIRRFILTEHAILLALGLLAGILAALLALLPMLSNDAVHFPVWSVALLVLSLLGSGLIWIWLATRWAVTDSIVRGLQGE